MPAPASLAIKPFFILSRLCEARASPRKHLSVACHVITTSVRLAALFVNRTRRVKTWIPVPVWTARLQECRIPGPECIPRERAQMSLLGDLEAPWSAPVGRGRWSPVAQPVPGILTWHFNHLSSPPCYNSIPTDRQQGKLQTGVKKWQLASYNTWKGELYLRLCKEIRRNFITEQMYHVDTEYS